MPVASISDICQFAWVLGDLANWANVISFAQNVPDVEVMGVTCAAAFEALIDRTR